MITWVAVAWGAPLDPAALRPYVATPDAGQRYVRWRSLEGLPVDRLVCEPAWPEVNQVCLRVWDAGKRRPVVDSDLVVWSTDGPSLVAGLGPRVAEWVAKAELVPVGGMDGRYLRLVDGDGWAAAVILRPEVVAERLGGGPIRVAVPAESVAVAWKVGGAELDRVMAVGVRELFENTTGAVSPKIQTWDAGRWMPFGEALPTGPR